MRSTDSRSCTGMVWTSRPSEGFRTSRLAAAVVVLVIGYHHACARLLRRFEAGTMQRSHRWFRWFNEVPVLMLVAAVILVVVKPF